MRGRAWPETHREEKNTEEKPESQREASEIHTERNTEQREENEGRDRDPKRLTLPALAEPTPFCSGLL